MYFKTKKIVSFVQNLLKGEHGHPARPLERQGCGGGEGQKQEGGLGADGG